MNSWDHQMKKMKEIERFAKIMMAESRNMLMKEKKKETKKGTRAQTGHGDYNKENKNAMTVPSELIQRK